MNEIGEYTALLLEVKGEYYLTLLRAAAAATEFNFYIKEGKPFTAAAAAEIAAVGCCKL